MPCLRRSVVGLSPSMARVRFQASPCEICDKQSGIGTGFSPSTSVSPVSTIPPMLHTHSFIYHRHCVMFFSQYFSFPCQYHSTNAPYSFTHLPPTLYNVFLPVLQFALSVSFHKWTKHLKTTNTNTLSHTLSLHDALPISSVVDEWMSMEHWWNDTDRGNWSTVRKTLYSVGGRWMNEYGALMEWYWQGKLKYWEKNIIQRRW
jgi:hypothetical protein